MSFQAAFRLVSIAVALLFPVWAQAQMNTNTDDSSDIVQTIRTFFNALEAGNEAQFASVVTPDYYSFEGGTRFSSQEILAFIKAQRAAGKFYRWNVSDADVHVMGNNAWVSYLNKGAITDSSGTIDYEWLESAFLEKQGSVWKIAFLHSTRVPKPVEKSG
jgi:ketosteroid isomerase-like protein